MPDDAHPPLGGVNLFDPDFLQDPHPYYARLRREAPVFRDPLTGVVQVSTYDLVMEVNRQPLVFSNEFSGALRAGAVTQMDPEEGAILAEGVQVANTMLTADPPAHTRYRKLAGQAFTFKRVEGMAEKVAEVANGLIDAFIADGRCEFKRQFADLLPMTMIVDSLGARRADIPLFFEWSHAFVAQLGGVADRETRLDAARKINAFQRYFIDIIEEKRARPTDDVISDLVHASLASEGDPRTMDYSELLSIIQQLLVAGNETTAHSLTAAIYFLITNPDQMAAVRADPELIGGLVEETLRVLTPTNNMWRRATRDAEIGGFPVKAGEMILVRYGSANRDRSHFPDADRFYVHRENARSHLAFGAGIHTCIGAPLARKEMQIALPIVLDRMRNPRLSPEQKEMRYSPNILLRGVLELNLEFDPS